MTAATLPAYTLSTSLTMLKKFSGNESRKLKLTLAGINLNIETYLTKSCWCRTVKGHITEAWQHGQRSTPVHMPPEQQYIIVILLFSSNDIDDFINCKWIRFFLLLLIRSLFFSARPIIVEHLRSSLSMTYSATMECYLIETIESLICSLPCDSDSRLPFVMHKLNGKSFRLPVRYLIMTYPRPK